MDPARSDMHFASGTSRLAAHVISVLQKRQTPYQQGVRQFIFDYLSRAVVYQPEFRADLVLAELRGFRLGVDTIIDNYIPAVATELGDMWVRSDVDFAQVTIGALRLQSLLVEATAESVPVITTPSQENAVLLIVPDGEQHFLGASVVAAQLRRLGCGVTTSFCEPHEIVMARIVNDHMNAVLFTCARSGGLETIAQTVFSIRQLVDPAPLMILGGSLVGSTPDEKDLQEATGVDVVTNSAADVMSLCYKQSKDETRT